MNNNRALKRLMRRNRLNCAQVAQLLGKHHVTVKRWHACIYEMPNAELAYLKTKLAA